MLTSLEKKVLAAVKKEEVVPFLQGMIRIPSMSANEQSKKGSEGVKKGSPIKRPLSRGKTSPMQEICCCCRCWTLGRCHLSLCRDFFPISVTAFTAPVTHQDQGP
jgi:hypothetical protein